MELYLRRTIVFALCIFQINCFQKYKHDHYEK